MLSRQTSAEDANYRKKIRIRTRPQVTCQVATCYLFLIPFIIITNIYKAWKNTITNTHVPTKHCDFFQLHLKTSLYFLDYISFLTSPVIIIVLNLFRMCFYVNYTCICIHRWYTVLFCMFWNIKINTIV